MNISLIKSAEEDLESFFYNQTDEEANYMAAFTPKNTMDKEAYISKWQQLLASETIHMQSIILNDILIGCVVKFEIDGDAEITYAIHKAFWNLGATSKALEQFLKLEQCRPLHGRVAHDNMASQRVLEKNGFVKIGKDIGYANARGKEIEEYIYRLER